MQDYLIETPRLGLRNWQESDYAPFAALNADVEVRRYFPGLLDQQASNAIIDSLKAKMETEGFTFWAVDELQTGEFIGMIGITTTDLGLDFTPCVEIGWRLKQSAWGKGFATEGAKAALKFGFDNFQIQKIYSWTTRTNHPSENVMKKIGMKKNGEFLHPKIETGHWIQPHVLYLIDKTEWLALDVTL